MKRIAKFFATALLAAILFVSLTACVAYKYDEETNTWKGVVFPSYIEMVD